MTQSLYRVHARSGSRATSPERGKARFFRNNEFLLGLSDEVVGELERVAREVNFRKKQDLWSPGDPADRVFFIRSGVCKVAKPMDETRELTLEFLTRGALIGEASVLVGGVHDTRCEAYEDGTLFAIHATEFSRAMQRHAGLACMVAQIAGRRRQRLENRLKNLIFRTAHARLAGLFLDLAEDFGVRDSRGVIINLKLTHREMAALIGATRETVSFAILDLRKDELVLTEGRRVVLLDAERLVSLRDQ